MDDLLLTFSPPFAAVAMELCREGARREKRVMEAARAGE